MVWRGVIGCEWVGFEEVGWEGVGRDMIGGLNGTMRNEMRWDGLECWELGEDGMAGDGMRRDAMGWDGWGGMG